MEPNNTFLNNVAVRLIQEYSDQLSEVQIILPNNRAKIFLTEALKNNLPIDAVFFAPKIIAIQDFIREISELSILNPVDLLFHFYDVYLVVCKERNIMPHEFDMFSGWANMLLADFNEMDRYLLEPNRVFSYLKDIEYIKHWSVDLDQRTDLIQKHLEFWNLMPVYYEKLYDYLLEKKVAYQGMMYREAVGKINQFIFKNSNISIVFAGFNALNKAEEQIIQTFLFENRTKVFWDIDEVFMKDVYHDAGLFARDIRKWKYYQNNPFEWIVSEFSKTKKIEIINTPKSVGQARIAGSIVKKWIEENKDLNRSAVVLSEEKLLLPVLHSMPLEVGPLNITMGYESVSNPVQLFVSKWFKMHLNASKRDNKRGVYYHKEVIEVFSHPLFSKMISTRKFIAEVNKKNLTFFTHKHLTEMLDDRDDFINVIIAKWDKGIPNILDNILQCLYFFRKQLLDEKDYITLAFLHSIHNTIIKIQNYVTNYSHINSLEQLYGIYKQVVELEEVSFEGEPLQGLQIMGVLESRVLDFERVIITSVNEGKFPAGKSNNSFIPHDVKMELGLPTYKQKDAIYSYHFYHLLMRANEVYLIYNSDSEGLDKGEKSRFITQIELEPQAKHQIIRKGYFAEIPNQASKSIQVPKSPALLQRLEEIARHKGFSPSALSGYLRDPFQFYLQRVLKINETDEVEENVALNTLGTIIHAALENLYRPYLNHKLEEKDIEAIMSFANEEIEKQFEEIYAKTEKHTGKNLLALEVAKRNIYHFLQQEKKELASGDELFIIGLEEELGVEIVDDRLPYPVKIRGYVDRIEMRNGKIRIIDYKTGRVQKSELKISKDKMFSADLKYEKVIQLLGYAMMYHDKTHNYPLQVGIYSFKNRKEGTMILEQTEGRTMVSDIVDDDLLKHYHEEIVNLIIEILNPEIFFKKK